MKTDLFAQTIAAMKEASHYERNLPVLKGGVFCQSEFAVNNLELYPFLKSKLSFESFRKAFLLVDGKGLFSLSFCHDIPLVTEVAGARHMTRKWPRDMVGMECLIKDKYPEHYENGLLKIARAYCSRREVKAFETVIQNPGSYKKNCGIVHIFWQNLKSGYLYRDRKWLMRQRLESHGEVLRALVEYIGSSSDSIKKLDNYVCKAIVYFTHYLYSLGVYASTCGPWEEIAFPKGTNWDAASVVLALRAVIKLMRELPLEIKKRFYQKENYLCRKLGCPCLLSDLKRIEAFCKRSEKVIRLFYCDEFRGCTDRCDSSSIMLTASDFRFDDDEITDIKKRLDILKIFEERLVGKFGARRYSQFELFLKTGKISSCDSYLQKNYNILLDNRFLQITKEKNRWIKYHNGELHEKEKSSESDDVRMFRRRAVTSDEASSAQWGLPISYAAISYAKMVRRLFQIKDKTEEARELLRLCLVGQETYIKRCYALVTGYYPDGRIPLRADGCLSLPWRKPEAYQAVSFYEQPQKWGFLPGVNSHLGWDAAKCWEASLLVLENLKQAES